MDLQVELAVIGAIQAIIVALFGGWFARDSHKRQERAMLHEEIDLQAMRLTSASIKLSIAIAKTMESNELNDALAKALATDDEYEEFLRVTVARHGIGKE